MQTSVIGYPRIGKQRELKFATEQYFKHSIPQQELQAVAADLRKTHWTTQHTHGIDFIPANDFSFYDTMLDTAMLLNAVPARYQQLGLNALDTCFAMARGYQGAHGDVKALAMKKWFNTNYHYMVPELEDATQIRLAGTAPFDAYAEAKALGVETKPVIPGAFTFLKLAKCTGNKALPDFVPDVIAAYSDILQQCDALGVAWVQFDEPALVMDLSPEDITLLQTLYHAILPQKGNVHVLLQTYFGDIRDCYREVTALPFDGIGLDFAEGKQSLSLVERFGFPADKTLFAGILNGKNIWRNHYANTLRILDALKPCCQSLVLGTSCSLLHIPYTLDGETRLPDSQKKHLAFAQEKLAELAQLQQIAALPDPAADAVYRENDVLFHDTPARRNDAVRAAVAALTDKDCIRHPGFAQREAVQKAALRLPLLPTTTIGSFPQTKDVKANRSRYKRGEIAFAQYTALNREKIKECIVLQETIGLDVLVHGEFERNDMVEYFGEHLDGFLFTDKAWVQSYGTRCVKPPILWGDIARTQPITVEYAVYAQSLSQKPVKGMLTGPVTILNWSFPREDIPLRECALQLALAIRAEVLDLEANGIRIIQIDEAALREKLPLRQSDWHDDYLCWAIPAFRLVHSGVKPETQIHTHMCYSEFADIIKEIDAMDADVITFEAARSDLGIVDTLRAAGFQTAVGPGVYDIHSPRIPTVTEIEDALTRMLTKIPQEKLWVNPDCGLKTRGYEETVPSLQHLVAAAKAIRKRLGV